jgi:hypothetical protein
MALRFCDSFDHYVTADLTEKWTSKTGSPTISAGTGRRSTASFQVSVNNRYVRQTLDAQATWILGAAVKITTLPGSNSTALFAVWDAGSLQCDLRVLPDGTLRVTRNGTTLGTTTYALSTGVWYYIEFKVLINDTTGTAEVKVDGSSKLALTSQDTKATANATANQISLGDSAALVSGPADFDDFYACDGAGSTNNNFLGDVRVDAYLPSGNGNSSVLVGSDGNSTDNYLLVDDPTTLDDDTTYVQSSTSGDLDDYAFADMTHTPTSIFGIQVLVNAKKDDAGSRSVATLTRSGSTNYAGATQALGTSYTYYSDIRETDPDTAVAWTKAGFNAASHGVKVAA